MELVPATETAFGVAQTPMEAYEIKVTYADGTVRTYDEYGFRDEFDNYISMYQSETKTTATGKEITVELYYWLPGSCDDIIVSTVTIKAKDTSSYAEIRLGDTKQPLKDANGKDVNGEITFAAMVPMQVYNTLQVPEERERLTHIRHLIIGGGAIDASLEKELRSLPGNIAIWSTYGMTETLSHIALRRINGAEASEWYQPFDSVKISQTDEGCLVIDAPLVCAETLVTNDIVEIEPYIYNKVENHEEVENHNKVEKLRFRIKGRKDNVICSGGIKIQIEEVEALLKPHLEKPFMIAKKKDEKFGEIAVLLTEDEDLKKVEATIRRLLSGKSDDSNKSSESANHKYWIPREYLHVDHLPLTETGKPKRSILL